jgi:hypothetical protein
MQGLGGFEIHGSNNKICPIKKTSGVAFGKATPFCVPATWRCRMFRPIPYLWTGNVLPSVRLSGCLSGKKGDASCVSVPVVLWVSENSLKDNPFHRLGG